LLLREIIDKCNLKVIEAENLDVEISNGYVGDLLSDVMGNAPGDSIWLTVQSHMNIVAVASIVGVKAIVLCNGLTYEDETREKAKENAIALLSSSENSFKTCMKLFEAGLR